MVNVYNKEGKAAGHADLPAVFSTPLRTDLIRKAVKVARANRRQRYGAMPVAGERPSVEWPGKGKGMARTPRKKQASDAAFVPNAFKGRRAHPPESRHFWTLRIPRQERQLAIASAIAATANGEAVRARGHKVDAKLAFPVIVSDDAFTAAKTAEVADFLAKIGLGADLERAKTGVHVRAGMGKLRGRRYRTPKSVLIVTADGKADAARNLAGVDVVSAKDLSAEHLAPGGDAGRLTVYTQGALAALKEAYA
ncbi:MAG: large subunit ribosomal protein L4e [Thermoplasmata archaeon]|jgi:large subunit ribosomal protein L4e|nr:large subunit ribosomal protein L4e [Thermoplasmata archaeon]